MLELFAIIGFIVCLPLLIRIIQEVLPALCGVLAGAIGCLIELLIIGGCIYGVMWLYKAVTST